jgi:hypothetical protein
VITCLMPIAIVCGLLKIDFQLGAFGLMTNNPFSASGLILMAIFIFQGIVAFALWTEKDWAVSLAKFDSIIMIVFCIVVMFYYMVSKNHLNIRLEIVVLGLFSYKLNKIQYNWENFDSLKEEDPFAAPAVNQ